MAGKRNSFGLVSAVLCVGLTQVTVACGESKRDGGPGASAARAGTGAQDGSSGEANAAGGSPDPAAGRSQAGASSSAGSANASSGGADQRGGAAGAGGLSGAPMGGSSGSPSGGASGSAEGGAADDGAAGAAPVSGFAADFSSRAQAALKAVALTCTTTLPNVPVADVDAERSTIRAFIAEAVGAAPADITMTAQTCGTPSSASCAEIFGFYAGATGGAIYATAEALAEELEANATAIEVTVWDPMKDGLSLSSVVVMAGIVDGVLVGMVVFYSRDVCD